MAGGPGTGYGGLHFSDSLRDKALMGEFLKSFLKSSTVSNSPAILDAIKNAIKELSK